MRSLRIIKDEAEIDLLRRAGTAVDAVVERLRDATFTGRTEAHVARDVMEMTV